MAVRRRTITVCADRRNIVPGKTDIGNHADDGTTFVSCRSLIRSYDQTFNGVHVWSNGKAHFPDYWGCLFQHVPAVAADDYTILPYWDDQSTDHRAVVRASPVEHAVSSRR